MSYKPLADHVAQLANFALELMTSLKLSPLCDWGVYHSLREVQVQNTYSVTVPLPLEPLCQQSSTLHTCSYHSNSLGWEYYIE